MSITKTLAVEPQKLKLLIGLISVLFIGELLSYLTFQWLHLPNAPWPWSFVNVLGYGLYREVVLSGAMVLIPIILLRGFLVGGIRRYIAGLGVIIVTMFISAFILGFLIFKWVDNVTPILCWEWLGFLDDFIHDRAELAHFLMSELVALVLVGLIPCYFLLERVRPANKVLGDAHFASELEVHRAGFFKREEQSIIIGKKAGAPIYSNGFEHVLVFAPSGSGKTRSITIPNLFHYPYSVVCNDVKFTLFDTTSGYREKVLGHDCYCFAPSRLSGVTHRYNPLDFIPSDKGARMTEIQRIAHIFMPDNVRDPIWAQTSRQLFKSLLLFLLDSPDRPTTFGEIGRLVKRDNFDGWLADLLDNTDHYDADFYRNGYAYINTPEKTRGNVLISFMGYFELFDDPIIDAATNSSDFDLRDLRRKKMTIYLGFTDEDMERLSPLLTLFWQQLISFMIKEIPDAVKEPYPLLCLIDEFSSLGRLERLRRSLKLLREYRVRCVLMFQYIAQTYEKYSHDEAKAFTNIKTKVAYTTEDIGDAEFISKMLGTRTKRVVTYSVSNQQAGSSNGKSIQYQAIPLMRPDEVMKMPSYISLVIRSGSAPVKARQWIWYKESAMAGLSCNASFIPTQTIKYHAFTRMDSIIKDTLTYKAELSECID